MRMSGWRLYFYPLVLLAVLFWRFWPASTTQGPRGRPELDLQDQAQLPRPEPAQESEDTWLLAFEGSSQLLTAPVSGGTLRADPSWGRKELLQTAFPMAPKTQFPPPSADVLDLLGPHLGLAGATLVYDVNSPQRGEADPVLVRHWILTREDRLLDQVTCVLYRDRESRLVYAALFRGRFDTGIYSLENPPEWASEAWEGVHSDPLLFRPAAESEQSKLLQKYGGQRFTGLGP